MATETTSDQKALLDQIKQEAEALEALQQEVGRSRQRLWKKMVTAKEAKISSYSIAEVAELSQPRVMQIIQGVRQKELEAAQEQLRLQEDAAQATVALDSEQHEETIGTS